THRVQFAPVKAADLWRCTNSYRISCRHAALPARLFYRANTSIAAASDLNTSHASISSHASIRRHELAYETGVLSLCCRARTSRPSRHIFRNHLLALRVRAPNASDRQERTSPSGAEGIPAMP